MDKLKKQYSSVDEKVVAYVFNVVGCGNFEIAKDTLSMMGSTETSAILKMLSEEEKAKSVNVRNGKEHIIIVSAGFQGIFEKKSKEKLLLKSVEHSVSLNEYFAKIETQQKYVNEKDHPIELIYQFPILSNGENLSSIHEVKIELTDPNTKKVQKLTAKVKKKEIAEEKYDDGISDGNTVMLLEKNEKNMNLAKLSLGNVAAKVQIVVRVAQTQQLKLEIPDDDEVDEKVENCVRLSCSIPSILNIAESEDDIETEKGVSGKVIKNMKVKCFATLGKGKLLKVYSPSHPKDFEEFDLDSNLKIWETPEDIPCHKEFVISMEVDGYPSSVCVVQKRENTASKEFQYSGFFNFVPLFSKKLVPDDLKCRMELICIVDCSGSMAGSRMKNAREAIKLLFQSLDATEDLKINIVRFGSYYTKLFPVPKKLNSETLRQAMKFIDQTKSNYRQTDILSPLQNVLESDISEGYSRTAFLVTDGEDKQSLKICSVVHKFSKDTRVITVGIGRDINEYFIKELARTTNGRYCFISSSQEIKKKVMNLLDFSLSASAKDMKVKCGEALGKTKFVDQDVPTCFLNSPCVQYFFAEKFEEKKFITLSYKVGKDEYSTTIPVEVFKEKSSVESIGVLAGTKRINNLQKYGSSSSNDRKEIEELGLEFSLLTSETSFVVEAENEERVTENVEVLNVPNVPYLKNENFEMLKKRNIGMGSGFTSMSFSSGQERYKSLGPMNRSGNIGRMISPMMMMGSVGSIGSSVSKHSESDSKEEDDLSKRLDELKSTSVVTNSVEKKQKSGGGSFLSNLGRGLKSLFSGGKSGSKGSSTLMKKSVNTWNMGGEEKLKKKRKKEAVCHSFMPATKCRSMAMEEELDGCVEESLSYNEKSKSESPQDYSFSASSDDNDSEECFGSDSDNEIVECDDHDDLNSALSFEKGSKKDSKKKNSSFKESVKDKIDNVEGNLNKIIYSQSIEGLWGCLSEIAKLISLDFDLIKEKAPKSCQDLRFWMTALVIAYLKKNYVDRKYEWKLVVKKSEKALQRAKASDLLKSAQLMFG